MLSHPIPFHKLYLVLFKTWVVWVISNFLFFVIFPFCLMERYNMWLQAFFAQGTWAAPPGWLGFEVTTIYFFLLIPVGGCRNKMVPAQSSWDCFESKFWIHFGWHSRLKKPMDDMYIYIYVYIYRKLGMTGVGLGFCCCLGRVSRLSRAFVGRGYMFQVFLIYLIGTTYAYTCVVWGVSFSFSYIGIIHDIEQTIM